MSFWLHGCCGKWEGWALVNRFNHTSGVAVVNPTDRPKSVRNRCVVEVFGRVFVFSRCFLNLSLGVRAFVIELSPISSFFFNDDRLQSIKWVGVAYRYTAVVLIYEGHFENFEYSFL